MDKHSIGMRAFMTLKLAYFTKQCFNLLTLPLLFFISKCNELTEFPVTCIANISHVTERLA